jgi:hypothetical protein
MDHQFISVSQYALWEEALEGIPHPFTHRREYCAAIADSSTLDTFLYLAKENGKKMICPLSVRMKEVGYPELVSPYGFGGIASTFPYEDSEKLYSEWTDFWKSKGFITAFILQHPMFRLEHTSFLHEYHNLYILDLSLSLKELWALMGSTHRYEIRRFQRESGFRLITDKAELVQAVQELYPRTTKRVGASRVYHFSYHTLESLSKLPHALLLGVEEKHKITAVALFLYTPWSAEYFLNASTEEGRKYTRLLIWSAIEHLKDCGVAFLNLGGGVKPGDHLDNFKRRFGGKMVHGQILKQIINQENYDYLLKKYGKTVNASTDYFPAYWLEKDEL